MVLLKLRLECRAVAEAAEVLRRPMVQRTGDSRVLRTPAELSAAGGVYEVCMRAAYFCEGCGTSGRTMRAAARSGSAYTTLNLADDDLLCMGALAR